MRPAQGLQRRDLEHSLAGELAHARESVRLAKLRVKEVIRLDPSGTPASDLQIEQVGAEYVEAVAAFDVALERWTSFVLRLT